MKTWLGPFSVMVGMLMIAGCDPEKPPERTPAASLMPGWGVKEIEASYINSDGNRRVLTTSALPMPTIEKYQDACASFPDYGDGGICYRVCGGPVDFSPVIWEGQWRIAHKGHSEPFELCNGNGCRTFNHEYYAADRRVCMTFLVWKAHRQAQSQRDLRFSVSPQ